MTIKFYLISNDVPAELFCRPFCFWAVSCLKPFSDRKCCCEGDSSIHVRVHWSHVQQINGVSLCCAAVPGAPPRKLEVYALNSTAVRVTWKAPLSLKQHGEIRGYQLIYSRLENGEPHGYPAILDIPLPDAQVPSQLSPVSCGYYRVGTHSRRNDLLFGPALLCHTLSEMHVNSDEPSID